MTVPVTKEPLKGEEKSFPVLEKALKDRLLQAKMNFIKYMSPILNGFLIGV